MRIIALIDDNAMIERILRHLKVWNPPPASIQQSGRDPPSPDGVTVPITYYLVPDIA